MGISFPNESAEYRAARNRLLDQEIALRRQMEALAAARRALPPGPEVREDYEFVGLGLDGRPAPVRLSELFRPGTDALVIYGYMFPRYPGDERQEATSGETARLPKAEQPCPSCTGLIDQFEGAAEHFEAAGGNLAVVANAPLEHLLGVARDRGWRHLRLLSSAGTSFKRDYHAEDENGNQLPMMLVFKREQDGRIRLFWASEMVYAPRDPGQDDRANGTVEPLWTLFDLTPGGRPDFNEQLQYDLGSRAVPARMGDIPEQQRRQAGQRH
jgi:predicted dithiol-disulfide oxidoreductase (DUF899 family)